MRIALALVSLTALAACGGDTGGNIVTAPAGSVENVAAPAGQSWTEVVERTPEGGFRMGNPDAAIKLVEYGSRSCPACAAFSAQSAEPLKNNYVASGKVSFEYRDFVRSGVDVAASLIGQCGGPAPFFSLLEAMMADQENALGRLTALPESFYSGMEGMTPGQQAARMAEAGGYIQFAQARGLPEPQVRQCLADAGAAEALTKGTQSAVEQYNIPGTPTFLLNGQVVPNATSWPQIEQALRAAGA